MPYINEKNRLKLDPCIYNLIQCLDPDETLNLEPILGDINYCFTKVLANLIGDISYSKIVMVTGVLENVKQEFYRRIAEKYEDNKIISNGDIPEYKRRS